MGDAKLGILLTADTAQAQAGLTAFNNTLNKTTTNVKTLGDQSNAIKNRFNQEGDALSTLGNTHNALTQRIRITTSAEHEFDKLLVGLPEIANGGKFAVQGITNELLIFATGLKTARESGQSFGSILSQLGGSIFSLQGALTIGIGLLFTFGKELFGAGDAFNKASLAAEIFKDKLDDIKASSDSLDKFLSFQDKIADLKFRIAHGEGASADVNNFTNQIKSNASVIKDATRNLDAYNASQESIVSGAKSIVQDLGRLGAKNPLVELALAGKDFTKITKEEADKLPEVLKLLALEYIDNRESITGEQKRLNDATQTNIALNYQIQKTNVDEQKRLHDLAKTDYEKYVNEIISKGKKLADAFKNIAVVPLFTVFDSKPQEFQKALNFLDQYHNGLLKIKTALDLDQTGPQLLGKTNGEHPDFKSEDFITDDRFLQRKKENENAVTDFGLMEAKKEADRLKAIADNMAIELNKAFNDALKNIGADAFAGIGEALGTALGGGDIKNVFTSFANTLGSGLEALGKQIITIGIAAELAKKSLKVLFSNPFIAIAAGTALVAAGAALKGVLGKGIQARERGGDVFGGSPYLVGERGPELFIPGNSGKIISHGNLSGMRGSSSGQGSLQIIPLFRNGEIDLMIKRNNKYLSASV